MAFTARDYMSRNFVTFSPDMDVLEAVDKIVRNNISGGPVVDRIGNLVGVLSEIDCVRAALQGSILALAGSPSMTTRRVDYTWGIESSMSPPVPGPPTSESGTSPACRAPTHQSS